MIHIKYDTYLFKLIMNQRFYDENIAYAVMLIYATAVLI